MLRFSDFPGSTVLGIPAGVTVMRTPKARSQLVRPLGPFVGLWTHFVRGRTVPCLNEQCKHDSTVAAHWKAYAPAETAIRNPDTGKSFWQICVWEITEACAEPLYPDKGTDLVWEFVREDRAKNARVTCKLYENGVGLFKPPQHKPFNVLPVLYKLWDLPGLHLRPSPPRE